MLPNGATEGGAVLVKRWFHSAGLSVGVILGGAVAEEAVLDGFMLGVVNNSSVALGSLIGKVHYFVSRWLAKI